MRDGLFSSNTALTRLYLTRVGKADMVGWEGMTWMGFEVEKRKGRRGRRLLGVRLARSPVGWQEEEWGEEESHQVKSGMFSKKKV